MYNRIAIVHSVFRVSNFDLLFPWTKLCTVTVVTFSLFASVTLRDDPRTLFYTGLPPAFTTFIVEIICAAALMSKLHTYSTQLRINCCHLELSTKLDTLKSQKTIRSRRSIRFEVGRLYFIDRGVLLTLVFLIIQNTINLLLASR